MDLKPGVQVASRYRIERVVADDRGGTVVVAREAQNGLLVALKVFPSAVAQEKLISRFRRAQSIDSPHVPRLFELGGLEDGRAFVAMEYLNGSPLKDRIAERPLGIGEAAIVVRQLCEALSAAHKVNVIHRRLTTAKLFEAKTGDRTVPGADRVIRVLGFATSADDAPAEASEHADYLAPEQLSSVTKGERSADVWAAGVILYELLIGKLPFGGLTRSGMVKRVAREDPKPPRSMRAEIPWQLEQVVLRCLDKNPASRIDSADTLFKELEPFIHIVTEAPAGKSTKPPSGLPVLAVATPPEPMNVAKLNHVLGSDQHTPAGFHRLRSDGQIVGLKVDEVVDMARAKRIEGEASRLKTDANERRGASLPPKGAKTSTPPAAAKATSTAAPPPARSVAPSQPPGNLTTGNLVAILIVAAVVLGLGSGLIVRTLLQ